MSKIFLVYLIAIIEIALCPQVSSGGSTVQDYCLAPISNMQFPPDEKNQNPPVDEVNLDSFAVKHSFPRRIVIAGKPRSGKGAQGKLLAEYLGVPHVSAGNLLREIVTNPESAKKYGIDEETIASISSVMQEGKMVPDHTMNLIMTRRLSQDDVKDGFILDRFPPNYHAYSRISDFLLRSGIPIECIVRLDVSDDSVMERLVNRGDREGRVDDDSSLMRTRIEVFKDEFKGIDDRLADIIVPVNGEGSIDEVFSKLTKELYTFSQKRPVASFAQVLQEAEKDMFLNDDSRNSLLDLYRKYTALVNTERYRSDRISYPGHDFIIDAFSAERIVDIFYLKKQYGFDLFKVILSDNEEEQLDYVKGRVHLQFNFKFTTEGDIRQIRSIKVIRIDDQGQQKPAAHFLPYSQEPFVNRLYQHINGINLANFLSKTFYFSAWALGKSEYFDHLDCKPYTQRKLQSLKLFYSTIGHKVAKLDSDHELSVTYKYHGGLQAGIITPEEFVKLISISRENGLNEWCAIWQQWSQREIDSYLRQTSDLPEEGLGPALSSFVHSLPEDSQRISVQEVVAFLKENAIPDEAHLISV